MSKRKLDAITGTANSISSFADFICFRKLDICSAKSFATGFCFLEAVIKSNGSSKVSEKWSQAYLKSVVKCVAENKVRLSSLLLRTSSDAFKRRSFKRRYRASGEILRSGRRATTWMSEICSDRSRVVSSLSSKRKAFSAFYSVPGRIFSVTIITLDYVFLGNINSWTFFNYMTR